MFTHRHFYTLYYTHTTTQPISHALFFTNAHTLAHALSHFLSRTTYTLTQNTRKTLTHAHSY